MPHRWQEETWQTENIIGATKKECHFNIVTQCRVTEKMVNASRTDLKNLGTVYPAYLNKNNSTYRRKLIL